MVRPSFRATPEKSLANQNVMEKTYPPLKKFGLLMVSFIVTLFFCVVVVVCILIWFTVFQGSFELVASICLSIQMLILQTVFNAMIPLLTEFENHKYPSEYFNSYVAKQFLFQSVNRFFPFLYLVARRPHTDAELAILQRQLMLNQFLLSMKFVALVVSKSVFLSLRLRRQSRHLEVHHRAHETETPHTCSFAEAQQFHSAYGLRDEIEGMTTLVVSL